MRYKRITLLCGHYGSGKTNIAVNRNNQRETLSESEMPFLGTTYSEMIQQTLVPLLRNSSTYLTPADYGFINY